MPTTTLLSCPNELLLLIAHPLRASDIHHLQLTNRRLHTLLHPRLQTLSFTARDSHGSTVLHWAVQHLRVPLITTLLLPSSSANASARDTHGQTPLHHAVTREFLGVTRQLLAGGADVNARDDVFRAAPLHTAARRGNAYLVRLLLDYGAHVDVRNQEGRTPLHLAVRYYYNNKCAHKEEKVVRLLLERGADPNAADVDGVTPLDWADLNSLHSVVRLLRKEEEVVVVEKSAVDAGVAQSRFLAPQSPLVVGAPVGAGVVVAV